MATGVRTPEQLLAYRPLIELFGGQSRPVYAAAPDESVYSALQRMAQHGIGFLVVLDGKRLAGVVSERDYARKVVLQGRSSSDTPVGDIMTAEVVTVAPADSVEHCMRLVTDRRIRHLPVVEGGDVVGVLSIGDLVKAVIESQRQELDQLQRYIAG